MKFKFEAGNGVNTRLWNSVNNELLQDLIQFATGRAVDSEEVITYVKDVFQALKPIDTADMGEMLFLLFDKPASMPSDARVDFVYRPTYIATTIIMTAAVRYKAVWNIPEFENKLSKMLSACLGRGFLGAGYDDIIGLLETLRIFAFGDTIKFVNKYPLVNEKFTVQLAKAITYLETEICTGHVKSAWSGEPYTEKGMEVLKMLDISHNNKTEYVWYACYGSNISRKRFMDYINRCSDTTPPVEDRPFEFNHDIYFAKSSSTWADCGKAFLDITSEGHAYGRIYKVTRAQYLQIKSKEGADYTKMVDLGLLDGIPVYSFTDTQRNDELRMPSYDYYEVILAGLKECYSGLLETSEIVSYLNSRVMPNEAFAVAKAIKSNERYLTNREIKERTCLNKNVVTDAVIWLLEHGVIVQDSRSIRRRHQVSDPDAFFYTKDCFSGRKLVASMIIAMQSAIEESEEEPLAASREGNRTYVFASRIERNRQNRINAIKAHGYKCQVCGFDYEEIYGELGRNYIEVHHINPLSEQNGEQVVDPVTEMACLCANCHRMIHRKRNHVLTIEELREVYNA